MIDAFPGPEGPGYCPLLLRGRGALPSVFEKNVSKDEPEQRRVLSRRPKRNLHLGKNQLT